MNKTKTGSEVSRRTFLKSAALAVATVPAASFLMQACTKKDGGGELPAGQVALSESDPVAVALGYKADGSTVDGTKFPRKATPEGANMTCANCAQYTALNGGWGKCNIFAQGAVAAKGWCNSWVQKTG